MSLTGSSRPRKRISASTSFLMSSESRGICISSSSSSSMYGGASSSVGPVAEAMMPAAANAASANAAAPFAASSMAAALLAASLDAASFGAVEDDDDEDEPWRLWRLRSDDRASKLRLDEAWGARSKGGRDAEEVDAAGKVEAGVTEEEDGTAVDDDDEPLGGSCGEQTRDDFRSGRPRERLDGRRPPRLPPLCQVMFGKRLRLSSSCCLCWTCS